MLLVPATCNVGGLALQELRAPTLTFPREFTWNRNPLEILFMELYTAFVHAYT